MYRTTTAVLAALSVAAAATTAVVHGVMMAIMIIFAAGTAGVASWLATAGDEELSRVDDKKNFSIFAYQERFEEFAKQVLHPPPDDAEILLGR